MPNISERQYAQMKQQLENQKNTIENLMDIVDEKDEQIANLSISLRVISEAYEELKDDYAELFADNCCDCANCDDEDCPCCGCEEDDCEGCEVLAMMEEFEEMHGCCCDDEDNAENDADECECDCECHCHCDCHEPMSDEELEGIIEEVILKLEKNPNTTELEKEGYEITIRKLY